MKPFLLTLSMCLAFSYGAAISVKDDARSARTSRIRIPETTSLGHLTASWYGKWHHGKPMANQQPFNMFAVTAAHKTLPLGTSLRITNPNNGSSVVAVVTDRGPYVQGRSLDLSYEAARRLGMIRQGVARLRVDVVGKGD